MLSWATKETATVPQAHNANAFLGFRSTTLLAEPSAKNSDSLKLLYWQALGTIKEVLHQSPWMWPRWLYSYFPAALCRTISKRALIIYASWREHLPLKNIKKDLFFLLYGVFHCQMSVLKCPRIQHCYKTPRINLHLLSISYLSVSTHCHFLYHHDLPLTLLISCLLRLQSEQLQWFGQISTNEFKAWSKLPQNLTIYWAFFKWKQCVMQENIAAHSQME